MPRVRACPAVCLTILVVLSILILDHGPAPSAELPPKPILRIETGMHTAPIVRIGIDRENRYLVTASADKTARVWDMASGRLLRVLRPPVGEGDEGTLYAVALSPDGSTVAVSGYTSSDGSNNDIYILNRESGRMLRRIAGLPNTILHLTYSPDGSRLAATLSENGIRVYETAGYTELFANSDYANQSYGADFDLTGRLVTSCFDGFLRLYERTDNSNLQVVTKRKVEGGNQPYSVSFSPGGDRIAVGFQDSAKVAVVSGRDLSLLFAPGTDGVDNGDLAVVAWSTDGRTLFAGGKYGIAEKPICYWSDGGRGRRREVATASNTIRQILPTRDGGVVFGTSDPAYGRVDASGKRTLLVTAATADYRGMNENFLLSADGTRLQFKYEPFGKSPTPFSLSERQLIRGATSSTAEGLKPPITSGLAVTDWNNTYAPKLSGKELKLEQYEMSRCLAIMPDRSRFLLGTSWSLRLFDRSGKELWRAAAPGTAWSVNISGDQRLAVAAFSDGTIHWYRMTDGKELLAFFPHNDRKRWVLWTPSGYYDCSPGAEDLIGWHVNNGRDQAADFFPVSKFKSTYYRPDVIARVLDALDEGQVVRLADAESGRKRQDLAITQMLPPVVSIISPLDGTPVSMPEIAVKFSIRTPSGEPVTTVKALVDGRPVSADRGIKVTGQQEGDLREMRISIPEQDCEVSILAENRYSASEPATVRIKWAGASKQAEFVIKPKLYVLAVGVSRYQDKRLTLGLAAKDATDFADALLKQRGGLYRDVVVKVLTDDQATRGDVVDGLDWIRTETTSKDVAMVFFAGHGVNDQNGMYYFLPVDVNVEKLMRTGVAFSEIKSTVASLAGKALFFVDTCHSGNVMGTRRGLTDLTGMINELTSAENGAVVLASSTGNQYSLEDPKWGNGAFTKALVDGINGKADYTGTGKISINMLDLYISETVKTLTNGKQTPTTTKPQTVPDFPIAVKR
jgi:WD40 repeat protein